MVIDYYPYGKVLREFVNGQQERYLTTQHERDVETGLDYRGARFYDADVARFLSLDPLAAQYPSLSDYAYVAGNPVMFVDPDGRAPVNDIGYNTETGEFHIIKCTDDKTDRIFTGTFDSKGDFIKSDEGIEISNFSESLLSDDISSTGIVYNSSQGDKLSDGLRLMKYISENQGVELAAYKARNTQTGEKHLFILPWNKNTYEYSETGRKGEITPYVNSNGHPILRIAGLIKKSFLIESHYHTHPGLIALDVGYKKRKDNPTPSKDDEHFMFTRMKGKIKGYIISTQTVLMMKDRKEYSKRVGASNAWINQQTW